MFLALYRFLRLFTLTQVPKFVIDLLILIMTWTTVGDYFRRQLGWHPREESSLAALLQHGIEHDLNAFLRATGETLPTSQSDLVSLSAKRIYKLRCELVHYRPAQYDKDYSGLDWNGICCAITGLICHIYSHIYLY